MSLLRQLQVLKRFKKIKVTLKHREDKNFPTNS